MHCFDDSIHARLIIDTVQHWHRDRFLALPYKGSPDKSWAGNRVHIPDLHPTPPDSSTVLKDPSSFCANETSESMQLTFINDSPLQTTMVDANDQVLYTVQSESQLMHRPNSVVLRREPSVSLPQRVGEIVYRTYEMDIVKVHDRELQWEKFFLSRAISFRNSGGQTYRWETNRHGVTMTTDDGKQVEVARFRKGRSGLFTRAEPATLVVSDDPAVLGILDEIVTTCCFAEERRRSANRSRQAAVAGTATAASVGASASALASC